MSWMDDSVKSYLIFKLIWFYRAVSCLTLLLWSASTICSLHLVHSNIYMHEMLISFSFCPVFFFFFFFGFTGYLLKCWQLKRKTGFFELFWTVFQLFYWIYRVLLLEIGSLVENNYSTWVSFVFLFIFVVE